jgi:hypothetical protein
MSPSARGWFPGCRCLDGMATFNFLRVVHLARHLLSHCLSSVALYGVIKRVSIALQYPSASGEFSGSSLWLPLDLKKIILVSLCMAKKNMYIGYVRNFKVNYFFRKHSSTSDCSLQGFLIHVKGVQLVEQLDSLGIELRITAESYQKIRSFSDHCGF